MTFRVNVIIIASLLSFSRTYAQFTMKDFAPLAELEGIWVMPANKGSIVEIWEKKNDSLMNGASFRVSGKDTMLSERVLLVLRGGEILYIPSVEGQNGGKPVEFRMTGNTKGKYTFENPAHDFPTRIQYEFRGQRRLIAVVSGRIQNRLKKIQFTYGRAK